MFNLIQSPQPSRMDNNLKTFMSGLSDSNKNVFSLKNYLSYQTSIPVHAKMTDIITLLDNNGKYAVYTGRKIHGIYLYPEIIGSPTTLRVSALIILVLNIILTMIQYLSSQLFQLSTRDRIVFANAVEGLDTRLMPASSVVLNSSHQVLEER